METNKRLDGEKVLRSGMVEELEEIEDRIVSMPLRSEDIEGICRKLADIADEIPREGGTQAETEGLKRIEQLLPLIVLWLFREERASKDNVAMKNHQLAERAIGEVVRLFKLIFEKSSVETINNELDVSGALEFRDRAFKVFNSAGTAGDHEKLESARDQVERLKVVVEDVSSMLVGRNRTPEIAIGEAEIRGKGEELKKLALEAKGEAFSEEDGDMFALICLKINEVGNYILAREFINAGGLIAEVSFMLKSLLGKVNLQIEASFKRADSQSAGDIHK